MRSKWRRGKLYSKSATEEIPRDWKAFNLAGPTPFRFSIEADRDKEKLSMVVSAGLNRP